MSFERTCHSPSFIGITKLQSCKTKCYSTVAIYCKILPDINISGPRNRVLTRKVIRVVDVPYAGFSLPRRGLWEEFSLCFLSYGHVDIAVYLKAMRK